MLSQHVQEITFNSSEPESSQLKLKVLMLGPSLNQNGGIASVEKLILQYAPPDVQIQHISTHDEGSIAHRVAEFGKGLRTFVWKLLRGEADVVHLHLAEKGSVLRKVILTLIAYLFGKPVLMHAHGAEFHLFLSKLPKWVQQVVSFIFRKCTNFIVLSHSWQQFYTLHLGLKPEQVFILPNSVELPSQVPQRENATRVKFVFCGRVGQRKGAFDLIKAFANLPVELKDRSQLILAGDGQVQQARELVESLNLTEHVTFLGWINSQQRETLLAEADVFVLPSYNEGLPMAMLEAMGWGLPTIATPVGGIPELVMSGNNGLLVPPGDIQQLSEAMQSLIENETLRLALGSASRQTATPFDVKIYSRCLAQIYRSVLESNKRPVFNFSTSELRTR